MGLWDYILHVAGFAAPALALGLALPLAARFILPRGLAVGRYWHRAAAGTLAGLVVLAAGLVLFGRDGKMATYAALVVVVSGLQWALGRGWRG